MKTTDKYISTISVEQRICRNEKATKYYEEHKEDMRLKSSLNAYKRKWGEDCINEYINKYGITQECIDIIKLNTVKTLPSLKKPCDI